MRKSEFLSLVEAEAKRLRNRTRKAERDALNYADLDVADRQRCIYGQMFGHANYAPRAKELKPKNVRFSYFPTLQMGNEKRTFSDWNRRNDDVMDFGQYGYSPLEVYIALKGSKCKAVVEYIKRERETFKA